MSSEELTDAQIRSLWQSLSAMHSFLSKVRGRVGRFDWNKTDPMIPHIEAADAAVVKLSQFVSDLATRKDVGFTDTDYFPSAVKMPE